MPRITKVYTRTGDDGTTGLGSTRRVSKAALRVEAYGTVDELNAQLGAVLAGAPTARLVVPLQHIQNELFHLGADLCIPDEDKADNPGPRIETRHVRGLEAVLDEFTPELPALTNFILPGGTPTAAALHVARTVCRRAERVVVALSKQEPISSEIVQYLNRLSDVLFVLARFANSAAGVPEPTWNSRA